MNFETTKHDLQSLLEQDTGGKKQI